jgi:GNAT superfamily N-acetyltransferase
MTSQAWPVATYAELVLTEQPTLRFIAVTDGARCSVHALHDLLAIGSIRWLIVEDDDDAGMIGFVFVSPAWRRHGVATALLKVATAYSEHYGLPSPKHVDERSPAGEAWAVTQGAEPARVVRTLE